MILGGGYQGGLPKDTRSVLGLPSEVTKGHTLGVGVTKGLPGGYQGTHARWVTKGHTLGDRLQGLPRDTL